MAMLITSTPNSNSSSKPSTHRKTTSPSRANTTASAYIVNAATMQLSGLHFSTSTLGAGGAEWRV
jgi:hypothetical protein